MKASAHQARCRSDTRKCQKHKAKSRKVKRLEFDPEPKVHRQSKGQLGSGTKDSPSIPGQCKQQPGCQLSKFSSSVECELSCSIKLSDFICASCCAFWHPSHRNLSGSGRGPKLLFPPRQHGWLAPSCSKGSPASSSCGTQWPPVPTIKLLLAAFSFRKRSQLVFLFRIFCGAGPVAFLPVPPLSVAVVPQSCQKGFALRSDRWGESGFPFTNARHGDVCWGPMQRDLPPWGSGCSSGR